MTESFEVVLEEVLEEALAMLVVGLGSEKLREVSG